MRSVPSERTIWDTTYLMARRLVHQWVFLAIVAAISLKRDRDFARSVSD